MKAVLLCAGFATRLYPLTRDRAKPLLPVGGRPIVTDLVEQIAATGACDEIVVVSNRRFVADFESWSRDLASELGDVRLRVLDDGAWTDETRLGAVRDLALAVEDLGLDTLAETGEALLVAAGDNLFRFPLGEFIDDYRRRPRNLVVLHEETDLEKLRRTGVARLEADGRVADFTEKPSRPASNLSSVPLYLLRPEALRLLTEFLAQHPEADAPGHLIAFLVKRQAVFGHRMRGHRLDLGNLEALSRAKAWLRRMAQGGRRP